MMSYNLTPKQKRLARFLVEKVQADQLVESFAVLEEEWNHLTFESGRGHVQTTEDWTKEDLAVLADEGLLLNNRKEERTGPNSTTIHHLCALKGRIYTGVASNFAETPPVPATLPPSTPIAHSHPSEIANSLERLKVKFPDATKLGFLIMRFAAEKPYDRIVETIKSAAKLHGIDVIRADDWEFHRNLFNNVKTYLHGCGFGIAIYERINTDEPNANVGLEVGYLMAMNKPVLLLKDKTVPTLPTDLAGELYKEFDPHNPESTIPDQLAKWLEHNGIVTRTQH